MGYSPCGRKRSDTTERITLSPPTQVREFLIPLACFFHNTIFVLVFFGGAIMRYDLLVSKFLFKNAFIQHLCNRSLIPQLHSGATELGYF